MRHRNLVFAAIFGLLASFAVHAQDVERYPLGNDPVVDRSERGGRKADPLTPQVMGQVTDIFGRSIRGAEVRFIAIDVDEAVSVKSNAFGYYQTAELTPGRSYLVSVQHRKYLFLIVPVEVFVGDEAIEYNFFGELAR